MDSLDSFFDCLRGALTSEVFWSINIACLCLMWYPVGYATAIFLSEGTFLKPILVIGVYVQMVLGAVIAGFNEWSLRRKK